jgi:hypothetical protein
MDAARRLNAAARWVYLVLFALVGFFTLAT